ncbi:MAG TPA: patatin-like phospholipase family protein [Acidimicrobiales bacterium]|nr:patatin-like phospholipase family protein [Acidimicrobiales bacterium]
MTTAWVFRGGASFAAAQVGMAQALLEAGCLPDMLVGSSAGALNAAWLAADPTLPGLGHLTELWANVRRRDVFPLNPWLLLAGLAGLRDHTVSSAHLAKWLRANSMLRRLEEGAVPLTVVATDIETGEEVRLEKGPAVPALMASAAIPGLFPPVRIEGRWLMDGSIVSDTPLAPAIEAGATRIYVLSSGPGGIEPRPASALGTLLRSTSIVLSRAHTSALGRWSGRAEIFVLPVPRVPGTSAFSFNKSRELIASARLLASDWLRAPAAAPPGATA